jgi:glycerophosphoryl diester phosphodiesterase
VPTSFPTLRLLIDVKQWPAVRPAAAVIAQTGATHRISIGTFSDARTQATAAANPVQSCIIQVPHRMVTAALVKRAHHRGLVVFAWTVNDSDTMARLIGLGIDGIITDWPMRLSAELVGTNEQGAHPAGSIPEGVIHG